MGANESRDLGGGDGNNGEAQGNRREGKDDKLSKMAKVGAAVATAALVTWGTQRLLSDSGTENKMKATESYDCEPSNHMYSAHSDSEYRTVEAANRKSAPTLKWVKPEFGTIKLNTDGARYEHTDRGCIGGLFRDYSGSPISAYSINTEFNDSDQLELQAIKEGIHQAARKNIQRLWVESDCESIVNVINGDSKCSVKRRELVDEILRLRKQFLWSKVSHTSRDANKPANYLSKYNIPCKGLDIGPTSFPYDLTKFIKEDLE